MKTETTKVTTTLQLWAIPRSEYYIETHPEELPFRYEARTEKCWQDGAVKLHEEEVTVWVPEGIDLLEKAVETLKDEIKDVKKTADERVEDLQQQINNLLMLEYTPTTKEV